MLDGVMQRKNPLAVCEDVPSMLKRLRVQGRAEEALLRKAETADKKKLGEHPKCPHCKKVMWDGECRSCRCVECGAYQQGGGICSDNCREVRERRETEYAARMAERRAAYQARIRRTYGTDTANTGRILINFDSTFETSDN